MRVEAPPGIHNRIHGIKELGRLLEPKLSSLSPLLPERGSRRIRRRRGRNRSICPECGRKGHRSFVESCRDGISGIAGLSRLIHTAPKVSILKLEIR